MIGPASAIFTGNDSWRCWGSRSRREWAVVTYTIYVPVKILVFLRYGVIGLALVTSIHLVVNLLLQLLVLESVRARAERLAKNRMTC